MIPKIKKYKYKWYNGYHWIELNWMVCSKNNGYDYCKTFGEAFRYWLWHCGVPPRIAFRWFKRR